MKCRTCGKEIDFGDPWSDGIACVEHREKCSFCNQVSVGKIGRNDYDESLVCGDCVEDVRCDDEWLSMHDGRFFDAGRKP